MIRLINSTQSLTNVLERSISYVPRYDTNRIENDASNNASILTCVFVTEVMLFTGHYLATTKGIFTEQLASNDREYT
jgi:hypothetical protein